MDERLKPIEKRFANAKKRADLIASAIDEAYEFCLPLRERKYSKSSSGPDTDRLFDGTAPSAVQDLASQMLDDVWPVDSKPFELRSGTEVPAEQREDVDRALAEVGDVLVETINNSNFRSAAHEALLDWTIGTGIMLPEMGDAMDPVRFRALPMTEAYPDIGPFDSIDALFRPREIEVQDITLLWEGADLGPDLSQIMRSNPDQKVEIVEAAIRDWRAKGTETWRMTVFCPKHGHILKQSDRTGAGSKPFIDFSYMRVTGEVLGRGPAQIAMPDIRTLNLAKELTLEAADMALGGLYQYDDDGVLNLDNVTMEPRTFLPRRPGGRGIERVDTSTDIRLADFLVSTLQQQIKETFFGDDLGPAVGTPMSATEVSARTANRARRRAGPYTRLVREKMIPTVQAVAWILQKQGKIKLPAIDGRAVMLRPLSPITRAQAQDEILRTDRFLEQINARFGQQAALLKVDADKTIDWLARKWGIDPSNVRSKLAQRQMVEQMAAAAKSQGLAEGMPRAA